MIFTGIYINNSKIIILITTRVYDTGFFMCLLVYNLIYIYQSFHGAN